MYSVIHKHYQIGRLDDKFHNSQQMLSSNYAFVIVKRLATPSGEKFHTVRLTLQFFTSFHIIPYHVRLNFSISLHKTLQKMAFNGLLLLFFIPGRAYPRTTLGRAPPHNKSQFNPCLSIFIYLKKVPWYYYSITILVLSQYFRSLAVFFSI